MDARNPVRSGNKSGDAMKISIFGMGYVGVVTGACLARLGHSVIGIDKIAKKVQLIRQGQSPVLEPGLSELVSETVGSGKFTATLDVNTRGTRDQQGQEGENKHLPHSTAH